MNMKKYQETLVNLEQLHWHLHLNSGPDLWTAELLRQFEAAVKDDEPDADEVVYIGEESPQPAA
jgi:hypothetical protein